MCFGDFFGAGRGPDGVSDSRAILFQTEKWSCRFTNLHSLVRQLHWIYGVSGGIYFKLFPAGRSFHGYGLRQVSGLVHVQSFFHGDVISQVLENDR